MIRQESARPHDNVHCGNYACERIVPMLTLFDLLLQVLNGGVWHHFKNYGFTVQLPK